MTDPEQVYRVVAECAKAAREHGCSTEYMMGLVILRLEGRMPTLRRVAPTAQRDRA